jgi:hypothetical protein
MQIDKGVLIPLPQRGQKPVLHLPLELLDVGDSTLILLSNYKVSRKHSNYAELRGDQANFDALRQAIQGQMRRYVNASFRTRIELNETKGIGFRIWRIK